jgi:glycosyltransferase involved in cell wall biosynthesis
MKNILLVSCVFPPEQVVSAQISESLAESLHEAGDNVMVIVPYPSRPQGFDFKGSVAISNNVYPFVLRERMSCFYLPSYRYPKSGMFGRLRESFSFGWACYNHIINCDLKFDIVYINTWPIFAQLAVAIACKKKGFHYVIHVMDIYPESLSIKLPFLFRNIVEFLLYPIEKFVLNSSIAVVAISERMKNYLAESRGINSDKIAVIMNWQDESLFNNYNFSENQTKKSGKEFIFMYLGNIGPVADLDKVIDAFLRANLSNSKLVIAGSGSQREILKEKVKSLRIISIEFIDVPVGSVPRLQSQADVLILSMKKGTGYTSIPSKLSAYMFSKKPVISILDKDSDTCDAILEANCGWVIEHENFDELVEKFQSVVHLSKDKLSQLGENGYNYATKHFSRHKQLQKLVNIIRHNEV